MQSTSQSAAQGYDCDYDLIMKQGLRGLIPNALGK